MQTTDSKQQVKDYVIKHLIQKGKKITLSGVAMRIGKSMTIDADLLTIRDAMLELEKEGKLKRTDSD